MPQTHVVVVNWKDLVHPAAGGAEVFCDAVAKELVDLGFRVTLLASRPAGTARSERVSGYTVRRGGSTYTVYLFALFWLLMHRRSIDAVIDSQNGIPFFTPAVLPRRTPVALLIHHVHQDQFGMYFGPFMARVGRWLESTGSQWIYRTRAVCAVSPSSRTEIRKRLGLKGAIHVVPNGSVQGRAATAPRADTPTITCVGRLVPHKRWELLLELAASLRADLPDLTVHLVGTGPEQARLLDTVERLGLADTVTLHGFVSAEERDRLLSQAWLTVSVSVGEGWGLSMIEAAALGVPAVALDVPGLRDSVRDGVTGWLTSPELLRATVGVALDMLADAPTAARFAGACRAWADSLTWSATAARFHAVFAEEAHRLATADTRRARPVDVAVIVELDHSGARHLDLSLLRHTDQATFCPTCVSGSAGPYRLLLHGRDERDALHWLAEGGLDLREHDVHLSVCRAAQLLTWHDGGVAHSYLSTTSPQHCAAHLVAAGAFPDGTFGDRAP